MSPDNPDACYPSGAAAGFAGHARGGKILTFKSVMSCLLGDEVVMAGEELQVWQDGPGLWWVFLAEMEKPCGWLTAANVNRLAGKKLVEE
jgi:hypothetical protein